ncbi:hypothetical protein EDB85DRAFT_1896418 [Lactarius pseudohatsudake]|nr:hypothetical protein EDB85DRAFT_1896418 [Lactarius pseudohatsudake]
MDRRLQRRRTEEYDRPGNKVSPEEAGKQNNDGEVDYGDADKSLNGRAGLRSTPTTKFKLSVPVHTPGRVEREQREMIEQWAMRSRVRGPTGSGGGGGVGCFGLPRGVTESINGDGEWGFGVGRPSRVGGATAAGWSLQRYCRFAGGPRGWAMRAVLVSFFHVHAKCVRGLFRNLGKLRDLHERIWTLGVPEAHFRPKLPA